MLPEHISNVLCSLRPKEDKLTFSAVFEMDVASDESIAKGFEAGLAIVIVAILLDEPERRRAGAARRQCARGLGGAADGGRF